MDVPRNLVSDSLLIKETFDLARANGGRVAVNQIADRVFRLSHAEESLSALLVSDLLSDDPRFQVAYLSEAECRKAIPAVRRTVSIPSLATLNLVTCRRLEIRR